MALAERTVRLALVVLVATFAVGVVAVSPAPAQPTPARPAVDGGRAATSAGCGVDRRPGTRVRTVRVGGEERRFRLTVPRGYTGDQPLPLVVDLHGAGSTARQQELLSRARAEAGRRGWVVATPNAGRTFWYLQAAGGQDVTFIRALVADVGRHLCIDPGRRFAMGMSNGAAMAAAMTCAAPRLFAAVAPVTGFNIAGPCLERPVPLLAIHGSADPTVPYAGGPLGGWLSGLLTVPSVPERLRQWSIRNQCTSGPVRTTVVPTIVEVRYEGCAAPTVHLRVQRGGHTWPGGPVLPADRFGPTSQAIDATEVIFDFFASAVTT